MSYSKLFSYYTSSPNAILPFSWDNYKVLCNCTILFSYENIHENMCINFFKVKRCICGLRPPGYGCLWVIFRLPAPLLPPLHLLSFHSFHTPCQFPKLQVHSDTVQRGKVREEVYSSKWTALKYCEVRKGESTTASIKFSKCGQVEKNEETVKTTGISNFVLNRSMRDWDYAVQ